MQSNYAPIPIIATLAHSNTIDPKMDYFIGIQLFSRELPLWGVETKKKKKTSFLRFRPDFKKIVRKIIIQERKKKITGILTLKQVSQ